MTKQELETKYSILQDEYDKLVVRVKEAEYKASHLSCTMLSQETHDKEVQRLKNNHLQDLSRILKLIRI